MDNKEIFTKLNALNVNEKTELKDNLTYLSWAWAWEEFKKVCPDAVYEVKMFNDLPYVYDERTGYMVFTSVTANGLTHDMWLPVMDGSNKAMKAEPYTITTKWKEITVQAATMFDVNKAIMRCLTKNLAMFGLGLYIYAGEDLPETDETQIICPVCGKPVKPTKDKGGMERSAADVFDALGMCYDCFKKQGEMKGANK